MKIEIFLVDIFKEVVWIVTLIYFFKPKTPDIKISKIDSQIITLMQTISKHGTYLENKCKSKRYQLFQTLFNTQRHSTNIIYAYEIYDDQIGIAVSRNI